MTDPKESRPTPPPPDDSRPSREEELIGALARSRREPTPVPAPRESTTAVALPSAAPRADLLPTPLGRTLPMAEGAEGSALGNWWRRWRAAQRTPPPGPIYTPDDFRTGVREFWTRPSSVALALLWAALAVVFVAMCGRYWESIIDDSFITFRFSRNLVEGHGLVFNPGGPRVEGYTNFTWMIVAAVAYAMGLDVLFAMKVLGVLCGLGTMLLSWRFCTALRGRESALHLLPSLLLATNAHFAFWAVQGMETLGQVVLVFGAYHFLFVELKDRRRWLVSPILAALAAMTRIDSLYYLSPLGLWGLLEVLRGNVPLRRMVFWGVVAAAIFLPYFALRYEYFGDPLPNTFYAKATREFVQKERGKAHLEQFYLNQAGWDRDSAWVPKSQSWDEIKGSDAHANWERAERVRWLLAGAKDYNSLAWMNLLLISAVLCLIAWRARLVVLVLLPIAMQTYFILHVGGDWMPNFRFFQIILPFLAVLPALGLGFLWDRLKRPFPRIALWAPVALALVAASVMTAAEQVSIISVYVFGNNKDSIIWAGPKGLNEWASWPAFRANVTKGFSPPLKEVADELLVNTQDGATVFMSDIGQPLWFASHLNLIDVDGLTDKVLADAPSMRGETFGGPPTPSREELREQMRTELREAVGRRLRGEPAQPPEGLWGLWNNYANNPQALDDLTPEQEAEFDASVERRYMDLYWKRATRYVMDVKKPEYILAFEQHGGRGPTAPSTLVYPAAIWNATQHASFKTNYVDTGWHAIKAGGDTWNHLYRRTDVAAEVPVDIKIRRLKRVIEENPRMPYLASMLYREAAEAKRVDGEVRELVIEAIRRFPNNQMLLTEIRNISSSNEDWATLEEALEATLKKDPDQPGLLRLLIQAYEGQGKWAEAAEAQERLLEENPADIEGWSALSRVYERQKDWDKAIEIHEKAIEHAPRERNTLHYHLAYLYEVQKKDPEKAIEVIEEALARNPRDWRAWSDFATINERRGNLKEALRGFESQREVTNRSDAGLDRKIEELRAQISGVPVKPVATPPPPSVPAGLGISLPPGGETRYQPAAPPVPLGETGYNGATRLAREAGYDDRGVMRPGVGAVSPAVRETTYQPLPAPPSRETGYGKQPPKLPFAVPSADEVTSPPVIKSRDYGFFPEFLQPVVGMEDGESTGALEGEGAPIAVLPRVMPEDEATTPVEGGRVPPPPSRETGY